MFMCEIALSLVQQAEKSGGTRKSQKDKQISIIACFSRILQVYALVLNIHITHYIARDIYGITLWSC